MKHVRKEDLLNLSIGIPPLSEQRKIASVLYTVDQAIQKTEEIIEQWRKIRSGLTNSLLVRGVNESGALRPPPKTSEQYTESQGYQLPQDWKVSSLQELCSESITYGIVQAGPHVEGGVPYVKTGDMTNGRVDADDLSRTSQEIAEKYKRSRLKEGDLMVTIRATVGVVQKVPKELEGANLTQGTARVSPKDSVDNNFLMWAIRSKRTQSAIQARTKGTTFNEITLNQLRKVKVPHPEDIDEQKRIAKRLSKVESQLNTEKSYLNILQRLKRGLMQDLLTGEVRTADRSIEVLDEVAEHG